MDLFYERRSIAGYATEGFTENVIYAKLLSDKLEANLGYVYENVVAQILTASGRNLYYYTFLSDNRNLYEVDFLISVGAKIDPIEVKSSGYKTHKSLDAFCAKYSGKIRNPWIIYTKDMTHEGNIRYLPFYYLPFIDEIL